MKVLKKNLKIITKFLLFKIYFFFFRQNCEKKIKIYSQTYENKIISSKSFIFFSNINSIDLRSATEIYLSNTKLKNNNIIYVCSNALEFFYKNYIKKIKSKFILVSGDSDKSISLKNNIVKKIYYNKHLICWYSQNLLAETFKLKRIPIGCDFISYGHDPNKLLFKENNWGPLVQEKKMLQILKNSKTISKRSNKIYCNFHFSMGSKYRIECYKKINKDLCYFLNKRIDRFKNYEKQSLYKFVLSPHGEGLDCHRTWESIVLGNIPIVKSSSLNDLYKDLPVLLVNDWSDVNINLLENYYKNYLIRKYKFEKLLKNYWEHKIKKINFNIKIKNYYLFKKYLISDQ